MAVKGAIRVSSSSRLRSGAAGDSAAADSDTTATGAYGATDTAAASASSSRTPAMAPNTRPGGTMSVAVAPAGSSAAVSSSSAASSAAPSSSGAAAAVDTKRYVHLDVSGGSNNFGVSGGIESASGGRGGTLAAKMRHIQQQQQTAPTKCNRVDPQHASCHNCNPHAKTAFADNYISTTKYNLFTFVPMNLFEQFNRKANGPSAKQPNAAEAFYFLIVAIISLTPLSPKTPIVSVAPLVLVLAVSAVKEAIEDWNRYKMDRKINATRVDTWRHNGDANANGHGFESIAWADLLVGDLVFVREGQAFPADIVLLQSSSDQGIANIETSNLDGETNLKTKQAAPECWRIPVQDHGISARKASISPVLAPRPSPGAAGAAAYHADEGLSSRSNPKSAREGSGLKWPLKLPPMVLESSAPSRKLDGSAWKGNMRFLGATVAGGVAVGHENEKIALGMSQLLLRGCVLRNTKWIVGVVLFTGVETKLMLNSRPAKLKRSHVDRIVDQSLYVLFGIEFVLCTLGAIANYVWLTDAGADFWPVTQNHEDANLKQEAGLSWFTYLVLLDILIPISLYVSMELVKFAQAYLINADGDMYYAPTDTPAQARTSNLNEELGQVSYIFSDKTGTLTCNIMHFVACAVDGKVYGLKAPHDDAARASSGEDYEPLAMPALKGIPPPDADFPFKDTSLVRSLLNGQRERGDTMLIDQFLTLLATCHTVLPDFPGCLKEHVHTYEENCKFSVVYQASSPDEKALTIAAKNNSYYFFHREPMQITVGGGGGGHTSQPSTGGGSNRAGGLASSSAPSSMTINGEKLLVNILGQVHAFHVLDAFEFTSERARMSVILQDPRDGLIKVYTKGADTKMYRLLDAESQSKAKWGRQEAALQEFSHHGLRTLIAGYKVLTEAEYLAWAAAYAKAKASIDRREEMVAQAQNDIEQGLTLIGATAIEDRLQDGVPEAIQNLSLAGIKIWVLTGDKVETAINIARSCALVTPKMDACGLIEVVIDDKATEEAALAATKAQLVAAAKKVQQVAGDLPEGESSDSLAIVVSGMALTHIFSVVRDARGREILYEDLSAAQREQADVLRKQFLDVCTRCRAVVCCRVSPNQKAEVVGLVKSFIPSKITLAIGDGANDTSMIKAAHIGIGISGLEGLQAVMASDIAIAQFRYLEKLLLVHGHWSYSRISKLILYSFYKNITIAMTSIWFAIYSGFSAQLFYDPYAGSVYNIIFTSIPVMLAAVLDRDVSKRNLLKYPQLYQIGMRNECFNVRLLLRIIGEGIAHSIVLYFGCLLLFTGAGDVVQSDGQTHDLWVMSTAMYSYLVLIVNVRVALDTTTFTWLNHLFLFLSVLAWFVFILIYCLLRSVTPNMYYVAQWLFHSASFWLGFGLIAAICLVPEVAWLAWRRFHHPTMKDIVMEIERGYGDGAPGVGEDDAHVVLVRAHSPGTTAGSSGLHSRTEGRGHARVPSGNNTTAASGATANGGSRRPSALVVQVNTRDDRPPSARNGLFPPSAHGGTSSVNAGNSARSESRERADGVTPVPMPSQVHTAVHANHAMASPMRGDGYTGSASYSRQPQQVSPNGAHRAPILSTPSHAGSPLHSDGSKRKSARPGENMVVRREF